MGDQGRDVIHSPNPRIQANIAEPEWLEALMSNAAFADDSLRKLRAYMAAQQIDAAVTTYAPHVAYLSGTYPPPDRFVAVLATADRAILVTPRPPDGLPQSMVVQAYEDYSIQYVLNLATNFARAFEAALGALGKGARRLAIDAAYLAQPQWQAIQQVWNLASVEDMNAALREMRLVKSPSELLPLQRAIDITDRMYEAIAQEVREGASELDIYLLTLGVVKREPVWPAEIDGDYVSGPRTEEVGGPPTQRRLARGDLFIADLFPRAGTHCADRCRTYSVGAPSQALADRHALLVEALVTGEKAIRPGLPARELYAIVRSVFERKGLAQYFPHHAGHGIGILPSEEPRLIPGSDETLKEGMVITLEPGLYIPGQGGMRIEDNFLVTAGGARCLCVYPRQLTVL
jgi:Xaa-Pro dipeptidase